MTFFQPLVSGRESRVERLSRGDSWSRHTPKYDREDGRPTARKERMRPEGRWGDGQGQASAGCTGNRGSRKDATILRAEGVLAAAQETPPLPVCPAAGQL